MALATKGSLQACNSAKAQGGIQAAFAEDDSPELHAEDVMRSSHDTADPRLVEVLTTEAPPVIHWLEELGVEFTRENGGYRLARCGGASRKRLLQVGDRTGHAITKALREAFEAGGGTELPTTHWRRSSQSGTGGGHAPTQGWCAVRSMQVRSSWRPGDAASRRRRRAASSRQTTRTQPAR